MSNWNQPICIGCWTAKNPDRDPVCILEDEQETCAYCGQPTDAGIYVRDDPKTVKFPAHDD